MNFILTFTLVASIIVFVLGTLSVVITFYEFYKLPSHLQDVTVIRWPTAAVISYIASIAFIVAYMLN
jgi:hypothetical protein